MAISDILIQFFTRFIHSFIAVVRRNFGILILIAILSFAAGAALLYFYPGDELPSRLNGMMAPIFHRYSNAQYALIDLMKSCFLFLTCLFGPFIFTVGASNKETIDTHRYLSLKRILLLLLTLIAVCIMDYFLSDWQHLMTNKEKESALLKYFHTLCFMWRIFIPLLLFAIVNYYTLTRSFPIRSIRQFFILFILLWLFNEMAFEISLFTDDYLIGLPMILFSNSSNKFLIESILSVPVGALLVAGFYCAMQISMEILNSDR